MDTYKRFHDLLKRDFAPLLRSDRFKGSGNTFRRLQGERIDVVGVQGSRYGDACCVNLAVHYLFLPSHVTDPTILKECDCTFRFRLNEDMDRGDHWWPYGATDAEAEASVRNLVDVYQRRAGLFFAKFEPFPEVFERITPADIAAGDLSKMPPAMMTAPYAAMILARIMKQVGRSERSREFAEAGLLHADDAEILQQNLVQIRDEAPRQTSIVSDSAPRSTRSTR